MPKTKKKSEKLLFCYQLLTSTRNNECFPFDDTNRHKCRICHSFNVKKNKTMCHQMEIFALVRVLLCTYKTILN